MNRKRSSVRVLVSLVFFFCLAACTPPGPMEQKLIELEEQARTLNAAEEPDRRAHRDLVKSALPLIDDKLFTDEQDLKKQDKIMYRASLLASVSLFRMGNEKAARELYMNAYLIDESSALSDIGGRLAGAPLDIYKEVRIPEYNLLKTKPLTEAGSYRADVVIKERLPYFLIQMICGAILRDLKKSPETKDIQRLQINIRDAAGTAGTGRWDLESDRIVVKLPAGR